MSDEQRLRDELERLKAERDRYGSLVGSCMNDDGQVVPALENAQRQESIDQMRQEVGAVVQFLRDNRPT